MIIGFLGKGGSGKSTLSSLFAQYLATQPDTTRVLAIDADHNMDLTYNLAPDWTGPYFGASLSTIKKYAGLTDNDLSREAFFTTTPPAFSLSPADSYTETYSVVLPAPRNLRGAFCYSRTIMITTTLISLAAFASTFLGGLFALRFKDKLHLVLGFSAGAVIGVAFFDLIPEAIELGENIGNDISTITSLVALGFLAYMILDRTILTHEHMQEQEEEMRSEPETQVASRRGKIGAASFAIHSFIDGAAVGLAFQVSAAVGAVVAAAVLVHDFSDGINTVNLILKNKGGRIEAFRWLIVDSIAPVLGVASTFFFTLPEHALGIVLALFAGFFLYIGASDLLPESHHEHPHFLTTAMTVIGAGVLFVAIKIAGV